MKRLLVALALIVTACGAPSVPVAPVALIAPAVRTTDQELLDRVTALEARVSALEAAQATPSPTPTASPTPTLAPTPTPTVALPTPSPTPTATITPQSISGPVDVTTDGQIVQNLVIDSMPGQAMTIAGQTTAKTCSICINGHKDVIVRNVTLRGRQFGILAVDANNLTIQNVTVTDVNYCGICIFGGLKGSITGSTVKRVGMLRGTNGLPSIGDAGNSYGIKFEVASQAGGSSNVPTDWLVDHALVEDVPLWIGINAHQGVNLTVQDSTVRRAPRAYFLAGPLTTTTLQRNLAEQPVTKAGGTTDVESYLYSGWVSGAIVNNKYGAGYPGPTPYGSNGAVTVSGNVKV